MAKQIPQPQLVDAASGKDIALPEEEITSAIASGKVSFAKGARIPVISPDGTPGSIPADQAKSAFQNGYQYEPSQSQIDRELKNEYGDDPGTAFLESAASAATFGLSRAAERALGVDPEAMEARQRFNPTASALGTAAGVVGPLLAPEIGAAETLIGKAASLASAPIKGVTKAGQAVTEAALPAASKAAGLVAKPGSFAEAVLSKSAAQGVGGAAEGAAYGLGQSIDEAALGDPAVNAEKVISNVGIAGLMGGALGTALGITGNAAQELLALGRKEVNALPRALEEVGIPAQAPLTDLEQAARYGAPGTSAGESLRGALDVANLPKEAQDSFIKSLTKLKGNSDEIIEAARDIGAPVPEGLISASPEVQRIESMIQTAPGRTGMQRQEMYNQVHEAASNAVNQGLGAGTDLSLAEVGGALQKSISDTFEAKAGPVQALYEEIGKYTQAIPVADKTSKRIASNIRKLAQEHSLIQGFPEHGFVETMANAVEQIKDLETLKNVRTAMARASNKETRFVSGLIKEKLDNLEETAIKNVAGQMKSGEAKKKILGLIDQIDQAKAGYKVLREEMQDIGTTLFGKAKIYGPQDFIDKLAEMTPEKFASRLFSKNNSQALERFSKNFPAEMKLLAQYQRAEIRDAAIKNGVFDPKAALKQVDKLSPEVKRLLFSSDEIARMEKGRLVLDAMPKDWNPSHTSSMEAYRAYYSHPIKAALAEAQAKGALGFIKNAVDSDSRVIEALIRLEKMAQKTSKAITTGAKELFTLGNKAIIPATAITMAKATAGKDKEKKSKHDQYSQLRELQNNPEKLLETMEDRTRGLYAVAPNLSAAASMTTARALSFLASKLPAPTDPLPLSPKLPPSQAEIMKFERYYHVVENPVSALTQIKEGTLTSEAVETLAVVYPKLYEEMKVAVMDQLTAQKAKEAPIAYRTKLSLSLFLGQPLDSTMTPMGIQLSQPPAPQQPSMGGAQGKPSQAATSGLIKVAKLSQLPGEARMTDRIT